MDYIKGKLDSYNIRKESENILSIEEFAISQKEQIMKYKGVTVHKRKDSSTWYARVRVEGKQYYISHKTQKDCYNSLKAFINNKDKLEDNKKITLDEWKQKWLSLYKIGKVKEETLRDYNSLYKLIPQTIKNKDIQEIKLEEILENLNNCQKERQRQKLYDFYNMIFQKAEDNEIIKKNLLKRIDKPKHEKNHGKALTNYEQNILINVCKSIPHSEFMLIALYQGLRRGEVLGLTRNNIDFMNNTLTIDKSYNQHNKIDTPKNKQSYRTMPLFDTSKDILKQFINLSSEERIFNITIKQHEKIMQAIKEKTQFSLQTKDMRSTFMTRCDELGIPERVYQSWVGHKPGSKVTKITYVKHNSDIDNNYINIINSCKMNSEIELKSNSEEKNNKN